MNQICWAIALRLLVATKKQQFRCGPQLLEIFFVRTGSLQHCTIASCLSFIHQLGWVKVFRSLMLDVEHGESLRSVLRWGQVLSQMLMFGHFGTPFRSKMFQVFRRVCRWLVYLDMSNKLNRNPELDTLW